MDNMTDTEYLYWLEGYQAQLIIFMGAHRHYASDIKRFALEVAHIQEKINYYKEKLTNGRHARVKPKEVA